MNTYHVVVLGPSGSGKTVYLASLHKKLSTQGENRFWLQAEDEEQRKALNTIYAEIVSDDRWPEGNLVGVDEWNFLCRVSSGGRNFPACRFTYIDYAGGMLIDRPQSGNESHFDTLHSKIERADALLALLDGQMLAAWLEKEPFGLVWENRHLLSMLQKMQSAECPIQFVITKWDLLEGKFSLAQIRDGLLEIDEFKNLVSTRMEASKNASGGSKPVFPIRLIPVSSVGMGFAALSPDGEMKKFPGHRPQPFQVEVPLACVLPDKLLGEIDRIVEKQREMANRPVTEVKANLGFLEAIAQSAARKIEPLRDAVRTYLPVLHAMLPPKYRLNEATLKLVSESLIRSVEMGTNSLEASAKKKQEAAEARTQQLRLQREASLASVKDEESALNHAVLSFLHVQSVLDQNFPDSIISV